MAKLIDLTGQRFGKLVVTGRDYSKTNGTYWICQCDCGNTISTRKDTLTRQKGNKTSCGCDTAQRNGAAHTKDETGKKYGKLTVLYRSSPLGSGQAIWKCKCDCGNETEVNGQYLRNGSVQSCGCLRHEGKSTINETGNKYGRLTVLKRDGNINTHAAWLCECDCGNLCRVDGTHLRSGMAKSCGCYAKEVSSQVHLINEVGNRYGKLTVIGRDESREAGKAYWICKCDCGNFTSVLSSNLRRGYVQSCGCLKSKGEQAILNLLQTNNIPYQKEFRFQDLMNEKQTQYLRFDFAIFNINGELSHLIEFDGEQHFSPNEHFGGEEQFQKLQKNDQRKNEYCKNHNIRLIRIKYNDIITLEKILGMEEGD